MKKAKQTLEKMSATQLETLAHKLQHEADALKDVRANVRAALDAATERELIATLEAAHSDAERVDGVAVAEIASI